MRLLKSLQRARAGRNKNYEGHGWPIIILQPIICGLITVLFRSVGSTITPTSYRSLFLWLEIETIETYSFLKRTTV